jgi:argininosuccinate lyase
VADPALLATDLADYLVRKGVAFREAHQTVGAVVRLAEQTSVRLDRLTLAQVRSVHPAFASDWIGVFNLHRAMAKRRGTGMPGPVELRRQLARWRRTLD